MKANELTIKDLMIGDWVYNTHNQKPEQVCEILERMVMLDYNDLYEYDEIQPIPLTTEILEKNGFVTNDEQGNWKGYRIYSIFNANKNCTFMLKLYEKDSIYEISLDMAPYYITFKYVHQLQRALRLCEIDKNIEP